MNEQVVEAMAHVVWWTGYGFWVFWFGMRQLSPAHPSTGRSRASSGR